MQKEIRPLRKQNVAFCLKIQAKFNSEKTILSRTESYGFSHWFNENPQICLTKVINVVSDNTKMLSVDRSSDNSFIYLKNMFWVPTVHQAQFGALRIRIE